MDGMDDIKREGTTTRAALREAQRHIAQLNDELLRTKADAKALAEFIEQSTILHSWAHDDVVAIFLALQSGLNGLHAANKAAAGRGSPASHILYDRMIRQAEEETAALLEDVIRNRLRAPDRVTPEMRADILDRVRKPR